MSRFIFYEAFEAAADLARRHAARRREVLGAVAGDLAPVDLARFPLAVGISADFLGLVAGSSERKGTAPPPAPAAGGAGGGGVGSSPPQPAPAPTPPPTTPFIKEYTLAQVAHPVDFYASGRRGRILLGLKLRGFGEGKWNGFGGKLEAGESPWIAAKRELLEEAGIAATQLESRGQLLFSYEGSPKLMLVHLFMVDAFDGEPGEDDGHDDPEMRPEWFRRADIPYDSMWADDEIWLEQILDGASVSGAIHFASDSKTIRGKDVEFTWPAETET